MTGSEIRETVLRLIRARRAAEAAKAQKDACRDMLMEHMAAEGIESMTISGYQLTCTDVTTIRLDAEALRAELPDVAARYSTASTSKRLTISAR